MSTSHPVVRRCRALGIAVAVAVLLAGCDWSAFHFGPGNTNFNPVEPALTASSVPKLRVAWSVPGPCFSRPLIAGGLVPLVRGLAGDVPLALTLRPGDPDRGA